MTEEHNEYADKNKMDTAVSWFKKWTDFSYLHIIAALVCLLGIFIAGMFAYRTFCTQPERKTLNYNLTVTSGNSTAEIKAEAKLAMAEALAEVERNAVTAYNEKFVTLLSILTIFGIAWPLIIALLQFKFSEKELKKLSNLENMVHEVHIEAEVALNHTRNNEYEMYIHFAQRLFISTLDRFMVESTTDFNMGGVSTPIVVQTKTEARRIAFGCLDFLEAIKFYCYAFCVIENKIAAIKEHKKDLLDLGNYFKNMINNYRKALHDFKLSEHLAENIDYVAEELESLKSECNECEDIVTLITKLQNSKDLLADEAQKRDVGN